jgi:hypothetical protein
MNKAAPTDLKSIVAQIEADEAIINENLGFIEPKYMHSKRTAQAVATQRLELAKAAYQAAVREAAFAMILEGSLDAQKAFAQFAEDEAETLTVNAAALYERLAKPVLPSIGSDRAWLATQTYLFLQELTEIERDLSIVQIPTVNAPPPTTIEKPEDAVNTARRQIRLAVEDDLNKLYIESEVTKKALSVRYNHNVVPVVVVNTAPDEVVGLTRVLFTGRNFNVELPANVTKEFVTKTLVSIKKKLAKTTNN